MVVVVDLTLSTCSHPAVPAAEVSSTPLTQLVQKPLKNSRKVKIRLRKGYRIFFELVAAGWQLWCRYVFALRNFARTGAGSVIYPNMGFRLRHFCISAIYIQKSRESKSHSEKTLYANFHVI